MNAILTPHMSFATSAIDDLPINSLIRGDINIPARIKAIDGPILGKRKYKPFLRVSVANRAKNPPPVHPNTIVVIIFAVEILSFPLL